MRIRVSAEEANPQTAKPTTSSGPVVVWPPTRTTPSPSRAAPEGHRVGAQRGARPRHPLVERLLGARPVAIRHRDLGQGEPRGHALGPEVADRVDRGHAPDQVRIVREGAEAVDGGPPALAPPGLPP